MDETNYDESATMRGYVEAAYRTSGTTVEEHGRLETMTMCALGLTGESGEVVDLIKTIRYHGHELDTAMPKLLKEMGDVLWYWAVMCKALDLDPCQVMAASIEKLKQRYPEGKFSVERSVNREEYEPVDWSAATIKADPIANIRALQESVKQYAQVMHRELSTAEIELLQSGVWDAPTLSGMQTTQSSPLDILAQNGKAKTPPRKPVPGEVPRPTEDKPAIPMNTITPFEYIPDESENDDLD